MKSLPLLTKPEGSLSCSQGPYTVHTLGPNSLLYILVNLVKTALRNIKAEELHSRKESGRFMKRNCV